MSTTLTKVSHFLTEHKAQIAAALPAHLTADKMARLSLTVIRNKKQLSEADPISLMGAIIACSQDGLEPGRTAHLVPFTNRKANRIDVVYIPDYRGLIQLARNSGIIGKFVADVVRSGDYFEFKRGTREYLDHTPIGDVNQPILHAYAIAWARDGSWCQFEVMSKSEIDAVRDQSSGYKNAIRYNKKDTPWITHYGPMAKKTVAKQLCKYLPQSSELMSAIRHDDMADIGQQDTRSVLEGVVEEPKSAIANMVEEAVSTGPIDHQFYIEMLSQTDDPAVIDDVEQQLPGMTDEGQALARDAIDAARERLTEKA